MFRIPPFEIWSVLALSFTAGAFGASSGTAIGATTGHDAVSAVRHDWKKSARATVHAKHQGVGPIPARFGAQSVESRLAYLHARRNLDPVRFDRNHPVLGPQLALDDRLRAGQAQDCRPMSGLLPDTARTRYLEHRRSLDPVRFDHYHPGLGAILAEDIALRTGQGCVSPQIIVPPPASSGDTNPGVPSPVPPIGGEIVPPPVGVPEPGGITLLLLGCTSLAVPRVIRHFRRPATVEV